MKSLALNYAVKDYTKTTLRPYHYDYEKGLNVYNDDEKPVIECSNEVFDHIITRQARECNDVYSVDNQ